MRRCPKPLLAAIVFMALLLWSWPAVPAGCPQGGHCSGMHGGKAFCAAWRSDSSCCHHRAPVGQLPSETALGGPAAAPPFLFAVSVPDPQTATRFLPLDRQPGILQSLSPPLYLLHASLLN